MNNILLACTLLLLQYLKDKEVAIAVGAGIIVDSRWKAVGVQQNVAINATGDNVVGQGQLPITHTI